MTRASRFLTGLLTGGSTGRSAPTGGCRTPRTLDAFGTLGQVFTQDGELVVTVVQEGLVRVTES